ncbi:hypothetical protein JVU11DRAFT_2163 [Chiua virens]|nr:hypothetical protein JVU11DRAFT_2163 [Chiua virens]
MAENPDIRIHSMFRRDPRSHSWDWAHILNFRVELLAEMQFAPNPYKWIRYATSVVVGAQGVLSTVADSPDHGMLNNDLPAASMDLYYHMTEVERNAMVPIDLDMEKRTGYTSVASLEKSSFSRQVRDRDETCVLTGMLTVEAAHLLRHSKGDDYIAQYTSRQSRDRAGTDLVNEIDSVRNGILLNRIAHPNFGKHFAFLVTPNFAMTSADIDPSSPPERKLCTSHLFVPGGEQYFGWPTPSGSPVRMPTLESGHYADWPPDILFDVVYGGAMLYHFSTPALRESRKGWKSYFYDDDEGTEGGPEETDEAPQEEQAGPSKRKAEQNIDRENRIAKRRARYEDSAEAVFDDLMVLPYIFMPPERVKAFLKEAREKRQETRAEAIGREGVGLGKSSHTGRCVPVMTDCISFW